MPAPKNADKATGLFSGKQINKPNISLQLSEINESKKIQSFMFEPKLQKALKKYFENQGLSWGAGLRMVLIEYMKKEKIVK